ncbi:hypothetical protein FEM48_Zijuj03G0054000 [Ziziphus jujuba var. spinosa]|uniref:Uncharacterized protein n=1 Tax=Ziziphus jujuba var. spinosa TaxID=714518 RepID=A0A978VNF4_ZIZJJ|nr:hypothetical protein FEM48_Zijuj03G0054000 [Ziziphus jujuba var. spinosa]
MNEKDMRIKVGNFGFLRLLVFQETLFTSSGLVCIGGKEGVDFHNASSSSVPGVLVVMSIEDGHETVTGLCELDPV